MSADRRYVRLRTEDSADCRGEELNRMISSGTEAKKTYQDLWGLETCSENPGVPVISKERTLNLYIALSKVQ
ncbi:MAG: hypothetical protein ACQEUT_02445 [Bacillota bacterium]